MTYSLTPFGLSLFYLASSSTDIIVVVSDCKKWLELLASQVLLRHSYLSKDSREQEEQAKLFSLTTTRLLLGLAGIVSLGWATGQLYYIRGKKLANLRKPKVGQTNSQVYRLSNVCLASF